MRTEKDSLGVKTLDDNVYYGIQTQRAIENFPVSGIQAHPAFIHAYLMVKKAAAIVNMDVGSLDKEKGKAIIQAADEGLTGKYDDQFLVDVFQAGAGTSFNMNVNEVLANRALEILGGKKGDYTFLSPNDHVNMSQSSNDTFPTATHIAVVLVLDELIPILEQLSQAFSKKGLEFCTIAKSGRTHLMDAMPVTLGDEFNAYSSSIRRATRRIQQRRNDLLELPIGGTATGTGVNTHPEFRSRIVNNLSKLTSKKFIPCSDTFEALQSRSQLVALSGSLKELAIELIRISNDLRLLNSGPTTGLGEIELPPMQPGSSIMPGKVNPVMAECMNMICFHIIGSDTTVTLAGQAGQMELNVMTPVITYNILTSLTRLIHYIPNFVENCITGIKSNEETCKANIDMNPSLATLLSPKIGYLKAADLAKESLEKKQSVKKLSIEKGYLTEKEANILFDMKKFMQCKNKGGV